MKGFLVLFALLFSSCAIPNYTDVPNISDSAEADAWVHDNIDYALDIDQYGQEDYWASPYETLRNRAGDCEDKAILFLAIMKRSTGAEGELVIYADVDWVHAAAKVNGYTFGYIGGTEGEHIPYWDVMLATKH